MTRSPAHNKTSHFTPCTRFRAALVTAVAFVAPFGAILGEPPPAPGEPESIEAMEIGGVDVRTGTLLLSGQEGGDVDGALLWILGDATEDGSTEIAFIVEVEGLALISRLETDRIAIALLAYVVDDDGRIVDHIAQGVILDASHYADRLMATGLKFVGRTTIPTGSYTLRVMVREQSTGHFFMARSHLESLQAEGSQSTILPPVFRDPEESWVIVRQNGLSENLELVPSVDGIPAARPVLMEGQSSEFYIGGGLVDPGDVIEAAVVDPAGRVVAEYPIEIADPGVPPARLRSSTMPALDLPPGRYNLVFSTRSTHDRPGSRRSTPIVLVAPGEPQMWVGRSQPRARTNVNTGAGQKPGRFRRESVRSAYVDALVALASGNQMDARKRLATLERRAMKQDVLRGLRRIEDGVASELSGQDPRSLLPIALLHQQMVRRYVARREFVLAAYSRLVTADRAGQIGQAAVGDGFAEALFVSLASDLSRTASASLAREFLEKALLFDPGYRPALLALGATYERTSDYGKAANVFQHLVENNSDADEGRLRMAINLARSGHKRAAVASFKQLTRDQPDEWVGILAAQELARLMIANNSPDEALELLKRAIRRYPMDQRLRVMQAWVLDSTGRSLEAVEVLLDIPPAEQDESPRLRYGEWPDLGTEISATSIRTEAESALPVLKSALESLESSP